uniref:CLASP N-terminal domain-containing protein n=1 Tax=Ditylenchus dipsaci TaxID=166011 RepID=A0A915D5Q5_9BILA
MATSALNANHYIAKYVHHPKILAIILQFVTSKSKEVRRCTIGILTDVISTWESNILERSWPEITQAVKAAINDADPDARALARVSYDTLQSMYPQRAEFLFQELEPSKQRMLGGRSTSSSTHSINSERDNLPGSNRGLYHVQRQQNDFLSKRSASDLNHSVRKLNLGSSMGAQSRVHRNVVPNVVRSAKPHVYAVTPVGKKMLPSVTSSQPGSRSSSPSRNRPPRSNIPAPAAERKVLTNGRDPHNVPTPGSASSAANRGGGSNSHAFQRDVTLFSGVTRALKNVDMQARNVRPNVVRYDEDPGSAQRSSESPQDFYGGPRKIDTGLKRTSLEDNSTNNHHDPSLGLNNSDGIQNGQNKWYYASAEALAEDIDQQQNLIREICTVLSETGSPDSNEKEVESALSALSHIIRDGAITMWNDHFNMIFLSLLQSISQSAHRYNIKLSALRTLKDLCVSQPKRLILKPELAMVNVLNAHDCEDASVVRVAEDCGGTLALNLPTNTCLKLLITVIDDENTAYHQLSGAIKMLSKVLEKLPDEEVEQLLPTIVPRMMKCYENSQSMVRRAAIICLVAISNSVGINVMKPVLNASTLKLVQVYKDRMSKEMSKM